MTAGDLENFLENIGLKVERLAGQDGLTYTLIKGLSINRGSLAGKTCDIAIQRSDAEPYVLPSAIHTNPHLVPMDTGAPYATQQSKIGPEWQYWSRRYDKSPTPKGIWAHILTVLGEV